MMSAFLPSPPLCSSQAFLQRRKLCSPRHHLLFSPPINFRSRRAATCCVESPDGKPEWKRLAVDSDIVKDEQLQKLEEQLDSVLEAEDFTAASKLRDKLLRLQSGSYVSVLSANLKFYNAFNAGSIVDMAGCWLQDTSVTCKHPLGPLIAGYVDVLNSFGYLFSLRIPTITVKNVRIMMRGSCAWLTCEEHAQLYDEKGKKTDPTEEELAVGAASAVMVATNIYVKRNGQWYITHHTSQPIFQSRS